MKKLPERKGLTLIRCPVMVAPMKSIDITAIPQQRPVALILRHAERDPISTMKNPFDAMLTETGKDQSFSLGQNLANLSPVKLFHSPVPRCRDTAEYIYKGIMHNKGTAETSGGLFDLGGPYIKADWNEVAAKINDMGQDVFIRRWFSGELPDHFIMPFREAVQNQISLLLNQLKNNSENTINVTHDWNIMILREGIFNLRHEDIGQPDFLDGMAAVLNGSCINVYYHEHQVSIPLAKIS